MWSSFTKDEKKLILFVLGLLALGMAAVAYYQSRTQTEIFPAGTGAGSSTRRMTGTAAASVARTNRGQPAGTASAMTHDGRIDLNLATAELLETLPGIGTTRAGDIARYRDEHGGFRSVEELDRVPGIGPAALAKLRPHVVVGQADGATTAPATAGPVQALIGARQMSRVPYAAPPQAGLKAQPLRHAATPAPPPDPDTAPVNINAAGVEQLATLKYVGPKLAQRIIEDRQRRGTFPSPESLDRVRGIGRKVLEENRGRIVVR